MSILDSAITLSQAIENERIFGCWLLKDRIIPIFDDCQHAEYAIEILNSIFKINNNLRERSTFGYTRRYSIYRIMYRLGFARLTIYSDGKFDVEYSRNIALNDYQSRIVNKADDIGLFDLYKVR